MGFHYRPPRRVVVLFVFVASALFCFAAAFAAPTASGTYRHLKVFARVLAYLENQYVNSINREKLITDAIKGMVASLDPHSAFLLPEEFEVFDADTRGEFGGVGMEVGIRDGLITVITPISGSPAEKAGIEPGDQLLAIEQHSAENMNIEEAIRLMRGTPGTTVKAIFKRPGLEEPIEVTLERAIIQVESIRADLLAPGYLWIQVRSFQDGTTGEVKSAISALTAKGGGLKGILLDLRRNPGGVLHEAISLADLFISSGTLLTTRGRGDKTLETYRAGRIGTISDTKVVVLIDGASASAAEIVAGALQDHGRALLVGLQSFGKGSVQSLIELGSGFGLKLTIARYFTPKGRSIQAEGITPDVIVESRLPPKPDPETVLWSRLPSEKDLPGHLEPSDESDLGEVTVNIADFQLRVAAELLMGLAKQEENSRTEW